MSKDIAKIPEEVNARLRMENLDSLTEEELALFAKKYKEEKFPTWRFYMLIPYNIFAGGLSIHYTLNFKHYSKKFFKPKTFGIFELIKYGTIQTTAFITAYLLGTCVVTGVWNPVEYVRGLAKIQGRAIDNAIKFDDQAQEHFLFGFMRYFGLSDQLINKAQQELDSQKKDLEDKNYFKKEAQESK